MWTLLHALREWLSGHSVQDLRVFGLQVLWWGRIGRVLEFAGGLTVVIDLLGRERMEAFHAGLRRRRQRLAARLHLPGAPRRQPNTTQPTTIQPDGPDHFKGFYIAGAVVMALFIVVETHYAYAPPNDPMPPIIVAAIVLILAPTLGGALGLLFYLSSLLLLEAFVVTTLGHLGDRLGLESRLKWIGLWVIIVGFSMDLLAS